MAKNTPENVVKLIERMIDTRLKVINYKNGTLGKLDDALLSTQARELAILYDVRKLIEDEDYFVKTAEIYGCSIDK